MKNKHWPRYIGVFLAFATVVFMVWFAHQVAKLPSEPSIDHPLVMYDNFAFAIGFGLGLKFVMAQVLGVVILLLTGLVVYWRTQRLAAWMAKVRLRKH